MRMYDIIQKKRDGIQLSEEEINFFVDEYVKGNIPDYQASALLMAIYFKGMNDKEMSIFTISMANSGDMIDLSSIPGIKVDKHSTGGVGDKTTLVVAPIVAACGVNVGKMSGRGLGHTGGTIDKLESIPGFSTSMDIDQFIKNIISKGICISGQTGHLVPADKKLYALRDVTATINSIPLIASSIMSKKIAAGADKIVLDVKTGSGAFMKSKKQAIELARAMVRIGAEVGKPTTAYITNMDIPLGMCIGNSIEVEEAIETLKGNGPKDLEELSIVLASEMLYLAKGETRETCVEEAKEAISSGKALKKLESMIENQDGDANVINDYSLFEKAKIVYEVKVDKDGYVNKIDTEAIGKVAMILGAGRETKESSIISSSGIRLFKKTGDKTRKGQQLALIYSDSIDKINAALEVLQKAYTIDSVPKVKQKLIIARMDIDNSIMF